MKVRMTILFFIWLFITLVLVFPKSSESFFLDDFEYWDSPNNHGWISSDYTYPIYGFGVGYGTCRVENNPAEGSRVLMVNCQPSALNAFQPYVIANYHFCDPDTGYAPDQPIFSYKIKAPLAAEYSALVRCYLLIKTIGDKWLWLCYTPVENDIENDKVQELGDYLSIISPPQNTITKPVPCLGFSLGHGVQDSTWHLVIRNLQSDLDQAFEDDLLSSAQHLEGVYGIVFSGNQYSLDEISFMEDQTIFKNHLPRIWDPGPQKATIFVPFELILCAKDSDKEKLTFSIQIGGWGNHGYAVNETFSLIDLGCDPNDSSGLSKAVFRFTPQEYSI